MVVTYFKSTPVSEWRMRDALMAYTCDEPERSEREIIGLVKRHLNEIIENSKKSSKIAKAREMLQSKLANTFSARSSRKTDASVYQTNFEHCDLKKNTFIVGGLPLKRSASSMSEEITASTREKEIASESRQSKKREEVRDEIDEFFSPSLSGTQAQTPDQTESTPGACDIQDILVNYKKAYKTMDNEWKWRLSTGKIVEDAVFKYGMNCTEEHLAHSFVIDTSDNSFVTSGTFTKSEMDEIASHNVKMTPEMPQELYAYLISFKKTSTAELRQAVFTQQKWDQRFERSTHFDFDWIRQSVYNLVTEYEGGNLLRPHLEQWYNIHVWRLFDKCFEIIPNIEIARGESPSQASGERKNKDRSVAGVTRMQRQLIGRRVDLAIRTPLAEFGCAEVGRGFGDDASNNTKLLRERGHKAPKIMRDMFISLTKLVNHDERSIRSLEIVGLIHCELDAILLRLDSPEGYMTRVLRTPTKAIPHDVAIFPKALAVLIMAWTAREIVQRTISAVDRSVNDEDDLLSCCRPGYTPPHSSLSRTIILPDTNTSPAQKGRVKEMSRKYWKSTQK